MKKTIHPITLRIDAQLWEKFKKKIPNTRTQNGTIVELIEEYIKGD